MDRVLIVSATRSFSDLAQLMLGWRGWALDRAGSVAEAEARLRKEPPDLIVLDLDHERSEGLALCRRLKADTEREWPILLVSSSNRDRDVRAAIEAGCDGYLAKPIANEDLAHKAEELLGRVDRRRFPRISASMQISFEDFKGIFFEYSRDLSRNGIFIEMDPPLPLDTCLRLSFSLPPPASSPVLAYGRVVRRVEGGPGRVSGVGVRFIHIDESSRRLIDSLVANQNRYSQGQPGGVFARVSLHAGEYQRETLPTIDPLSQLLQDHEQLRSFCDLLRAEHFHLARRIALQQALCAGSTARDFAERLADALRDLTGVAAFSVSAQDADGTWISLFSHPQDRPDPGPDAASAAVQRALLENRAQVLAEADGAFPQRVLAAIPFSIENGLRGLLLVREWLEHKRAWADDDAALLEQLGQLLGPAISHCLARTLFPSGLTARELAARFA